MCVSVIQHIYRIGLLMKLIIREWREEKKLTLKDIKSMA